MQENFQAGSSSSQMRGDSYGRAKQCHILDKEHEIPHDAPEP